MAELRFETLSVRAGSRTLLDAIDLRVERGEFVALVGPNGAGKTTLLKVALALRAPTSGSVRVRERSVSTLSARERAAAIAWLPQHVRADEPVSCLESVAAARFRFHETHRASLDAAERALERVGASSAADRAITELSGGERQRVAFACLIAQEAEILLFDEPANHLDPAQQLEIYRLLGELWHAGHTVLCVNHDINLLQRIGNAAALRVVGLERGRLCFETTLADPRLPARLGELFGIELASFEQAGQRWIVPQLGSTP